MRLRVRLYSAGSRVLATLATGARALHDAFFLGWLDRRDLLAATAEAYARWSRYGEREWNVSGLASWELEALERDFVACRSVLVAGAGGGRECVALARRGLEVTGFDCMPGLVESARALLAELGLRGTMLFAEPDSLPPDLPVFAGVVVGWGAYMHIPGRGQRVAFLGRLRAHVRSGGPILLSFYTRSEGSRTVLWTWRLARAVRRARRGREPVEPGDVLRDTFDHHFTEGEVRGELAEAGFEMLRYAREPYGHAVGVARGDGPESRGG